MIKTKSKIQSSENTLPKYFNDFRSYNETEALEAIKRLGDTDLFYDILKFFFPEKNLSELKDRMGNIFTIDDFQGKIMQPIVERIIETSSSGFSFDGLENVKKGESYIFMSNHRDIFLDAALVQYILYNNGFDTNEITFGSNLMTSQIIIDAGKVNKMFKVYRKGKPKELMQKTAQLSEYIKYTQNEKKQSVWIAQRGGRTKDGNDKTQYSVLKMLCNSRKGNCIEQLKSLKIIPISVSYEYEPNAHLKIRESFLSENKKYTKAPGEDLKSIIDGVKTHKGKMHFKFGKPINNEINQISSEHKYNEQAKEAAAIIDKEIYKNYKLFPNNYIAADLISNTQTYSHKYNSKQKNNFENFMNKQLSLIEFSNAKLKSMFLKMYATPLYNSLKVTT